MLIFSIVCILTLPSHSLITQISGHILDTDQDNSHAESHNVEIGQSEALLNSNLSTINIPPTETKPEELSTTTEFYIDIPKIDLTREISLNVDPTDKNEYLKTLKTHVAHGKHTALPTMVNGNTYLFAHSKKAYDGSTPDEGWFTRIDELNNGDIIIIHYNGNAYTYTVENSFIVKPTEVSFYSKTSPFGEQSSLTLQTCYPRGDTGYRLIIQAKGE